MKRWHWILLLMVTLFSMGAQYAGYGEGHGWWERVPAFWAVYGFAGCVLIIVGSKAIGKWGVQRKEDYYDER